MSRLPLIARAQVLRALSRLAGARSFVTAASRGFARSRRGAVAVMFGLAVVPLAMSVGLAVDYGIYVRVRSQLNLAADTAAMEAVRVASKTYGNGQSLAAMQTAGQAAGTQWFKAQMGTLLSGIVPDSSINVAVSYVASPSRFTANVSYAGTVPTNFGGLFHVANLAVSGASTAVISNSYVEVLMLLDNSSSMLIGAKLSDIVALENATPCSPQSAYLNPQQPMDGTYTWNYKTPYGYRFDGSEQAPPVTVNGSCNSGYTGDPSACPYAPSLSNIDSTNTWRCKNTGGGVQTTFYSGSNGYYGTNSKAPGAKLAGTYGVPTAPCGFACHDRSDNNDYYALARSLSPKIQLRLDVVQQAAGSVVSTLQSEQQEANQFTVGIYQFNDNLQQFYPAAGSNQEAGPDLTTAQTVIQNAGPHLSTTNNNTNFPLSARSLNNIVTSAGDGTTPTGPLKNLFIVTDGMENSSDKGPMVTANLNSCDQFWSKGINVYVLYTPYLPLPNAFYLSNDKQYAEPTNGNTDSANVTALKACARYPSNFFQASDPDAINTAMQAMLASALNTPGRVAN